MTRLSLLFVLSFFIDYEGIAQRSITDSLRNLLIYRTERDTLYVEITYKYGRSMFYENIDSASFYITKGLELSKTLKWDGGVARGLMYQSGVQALNNKYDSAISIGLNALRIGEETGDAALLAQIYTNVSETYRMIGNYSLAEDYAKKYLEVANAMQDEKMIVKAYINLSNIYIETNQHDKADGLIDIALTKAIALNSEGHIAMILEIKAAKQHGEGDFKGAIGNYRQILQVWKHMANYPGIAWMQVKLSESFSELGNKDSAAYYAYAALETSKKQGLKKELKDAYAILYTYSYKYGNYKKALEYKNGFDSLQNETYNLEVAKATERARMEYEQEKKDAKAQIEQAKKDNAVQRTRNLQNTAIGAFILLTSFLFWNNRQKQKAKGAIQKAYEQLKSTQVQLIQSEKMASLGELTAGIAHEIQNPLNFVNNFSEVNTELIEELKTELVTGNMQQAIEIADNIKENEEKINQHGKRADGIVKGMLQHSQKSIGVKELISINSLAEEYLRLTYHSFQSKHAAFKYELKLDLDSKLPLVNIIPQDIGRVLLNLYNNAFYAMNERNVEVVKRKSGEVYEPTVLVSTKKMGDTILISVKDNGPGIPDNIKDKIFQPFFTTKPSGQGTGLGLSLSHDIIKAHGGTIKVETKEGEGTEFIIQLPIN